MQDGTGGGLLRDVPGSALRLQGGRLVVGHHTHRVRAGNLQSLILLNCT